MKKQKVIEIVALVCGKENLPIPKINFNGCPQETQDQLAHYHPGENKICISEMQLYRLKSLTDVENTTYHELVHILERTHGRNFIKTKNKFKLDVWRPPHGVIFMSAEVQKQIKDMRTKQKPEKMKVDRARCNYHLCRKRRKLYKCQYCGNYFCKDHIRPVIPAELTSEWSEQDSGEPNYHPCPEFVDFENKRKAKEIEDYGKALDRLKEGKWSSEEGKGSKRDEIKEEDEEPIVEKQSSRNLEDTRKKLGIDISDESHIRPKAENKHGFKLSFLNLGRDRLKKWFTNEYHTKYTKGYSYNWAPRIRIQVPIKAFLIAIATIVLSMPPLSLVSYGGFNLSSTIFSSTLFFVDFVILSIVILLYDKLTARHYLTYQALIGSFLLSLLFVTGLVLNVTYGAVINFIIIFFVLWIGFLIGGKLYDLAKNRNQMNVLNGGTTFLIVLWIVYLMASINSTTTGTNFYALLNNFVANLKTGAFLSGSIQPQIVTTCVSQLNQEINIESQKLPQGASISIANLTTFKAYSQINPWIVQWAALPSTALFSFQQTTSVNCNQGSAVYICKDLTLLQNQTITNTTNSINTTLGSTLTTKNTTLAAGAIVKIVITQPLIFTNGTYSTSYLIPALCNASGTLMPNSKYYLAH